MINYTLMEGKRTISSAANPFWMVKPIILNTTFKDLGRWKISQLMDLLFVDRILILYKILLISVKKIK
jgi:hypothetical protein